MLEKIDEFLEKLNTKEKEYALKKLREVKRRRPHQIKFFVSDRELEAIEKKVNLSRMNKSDYLRHCSLQKEIVIVDGLKEIYVEFKRQGTNLNQLVTAINSQNLENLKNTDELLEEYRKMNLRLIQIIKKL